LGKSRCHVQGRQAHESGRVLGFRAGWFFWLEAWRVLLVCSIKLEWGYIKVLKMT
jgi:hypothetical protein